MPDEYSSSLAESILFEPIKEGADKLCILTEKATPSMASWLIKTYEEHGISDISVELIVGNVLDEGIDQASHDGFKELHKHFGDIGIDFSCSYLFQPPTPGKQSYYIWTNDEEPVKAFAGSHEFTQQSILRRRSGSMGERLAAYAYRIYEDAVSRSIYCNHSEVEDYIIVRQSAEIPTSTAENDENMITLSLLARGGETGTKSGLNWGQRGNRNRNEAYIPLPRKVAQSGFFPLEKQHFLVVTDDHHTLQLRVEQQNDKAITTPASNALLGEYFRNRLGLGNGEYIEKRHLLAYGRMDVMFYKIDEEQYYMDFSAPSKGSKR
ncbi:restriction endonuclease PLD domain-containing protein [Mogibacterium kristiansenii]|uniref:NgoFVII family restriction endonuclease n=1 Tax=Mogibacterium kristiansenii TaxID=2606708 RepID=A0A6N7X5A4_9FIRM|nr:restriction endonuclease PLD domain-containing protein [Mogibacterium kristiansenii]MST69753.1 NgoFVII family restriction endonuclease [Mogibacterium kristiansenii]